MDRKLKKNIHIYDQQLSVNRYFQGISKANLMWVPHRNIFIFIILFFILGPLFKVYRNWSHILYHYSLIYIGLDPGEFPRFTETGHTFQAYVVLFFGFFLGGRGGDIWRIIYCHTVKVKANIIFTSQMKKSKKISKHMNNDHMSGPLTFHKCTCHVLVCF